MNSAKISIIIPCLNEAENIVSTLTPLQALRQRGHEVILVDGGSKDASLSLAQPLVDKVLTSSPGRATQMNLGAAQASGDVFCFLHADTLAHDRIDYEITQALINSDLNKSNLNKSHHDKPHIKPLKLRNACRFWGRFDIRLKNNHWPYRVIEWFINHRSALSGIATGDQGIFVCRQFFTKLNGFTEQPLMEDIDLSRRLNKISRPVRLQDKPLITSSRRWEQHGILRTIFFMWWLRLRYFFGTSANTLAQLYYPNASHK